MLSKLALVALAAVTSVVAQDKDFPIDTTKVEPVTKAAWCNAQYSSCGTLCGGSPLTNNCTASTLAYSCTCQNGSAPGLKYYKETMPSFICQEAFGQCNLANVGNAAGQRNCTTAIRNTCGQLNITDFSNPASQSQSPSSTGGATPSNTQGGSSSPTSTQGKAAAPRNIQHYGNAAAVAAVAAFAYLL